MDDINEQIQLREKLLKQMDEFREKYGDKALCDVMTAMTDMELESREQESKKEYEWKNERRVD